jgi:hypothetical protein
MKKLIYVVVALLSAVVLFLFLTTKISTAYRVARAAIDKSGEVQSSLGAVEHAYLSSFSQKTGPTGRGCTTILFYVDGVKANEWFEVRLKNNSYKTEWEVTAIRQGSGNFISANCQYG